MDTAVHDDKKMNVDADDESIQDIMEALRDIYDDLFPSLSDMMPDLFPPSACNWKVFDLQVLVMTSGIRVSDLFAHLNHCPHFDMVRRSGSGLLGY